MHLYMQYCVVGIFVMFVIGPFSAAPFPSDDVTNSLNFTTSFSTAIISTLHGVSL
jgi:hypothetical protein